MKILERPGGSGFNREFLLPTTCRIVSSTASANLLAPQAFMPVRA
jgi:hypothetical protein